ncbi:MAG: MFS transporter [bacterium]|nr:MFS transporter [bacterium]
MNQTDASQAPSGMRAFTIVWIGQLVSLFGTSMTQFALTIWTYELTGRATELTRVALFSFAPVILLSPIAGALVDRWNRKLVLILSDLAAGLSSVAIFLLYSTGNLEIWHLYVAGAFAGAFQTFQWPAYSAAVTTMLRKEHYARAQGMMTVAETASGLFAPGLAALLLVVIGIQGVLLIDIITFIFAISAVLLVFIPQPKVSEAGREGRGSLLQESLYGFRYILRRPSLLGLQLMFFQINLFGTLGGILLSPMILARTNSSEATLASVQTAFAIGGLLSGLLISTWGGPKRKVHGVLMSMIFSSILGNLLLGLGRGVVIWVVAAFGTSIFTSILNASNQAIWQAKVPPDVQGRVFSVRRMIAQITAPIAMFIAGPLADGVFEPGMREGGNLAQTFGGLIGTGPGAGMALIMVITGVMATIFSASGYLVPAIRKAETLIPDYDAGGEIAAQELPDAIGLTPTAAAMAEGVGDDPLPATSR